VMHVSTAGEIDRAIRCKVQRAICHQRDCLELCTQLHTGTISEKLSKRAREPMACILHMFTRLIMRQFLRRSFAVNAENIFLQMTT